MVKKQTTGDPDQIVVWADGDGLESKYHLRRRGGKKMRGPGNRKNNHSINVEAVILDMDGLMIDTEPIYKRSMQEAARNLGFDLTDAFMMSLVGRPDTDCRRLVSREFGDAFPHDLFWSQSPQIWRDIASAEGIARKPGLDDLLSALADDGLPTAIATSTYREQADFSLNVAAVTHSFGHIVTGDQVEHGKPAPDIFLEAARRLKVKPQHCIVLEDSENGIRAAHAAKMFAIMVPDLIPPSEEIRNKASLVLDSLHDVRELLKNLTYES